MGSALEAAALYPVDGGRACAAAFLLESQRPLREVAKLLEGRGCTLVLFRPELVVSPLHLVAAVDYALAARRLGRGVARSLHVEAFLFAAATSEISRALELFNPDMDGGVAAAVLVASGEGECLEALRALGELGAQVRPLPRSEAAARVLARELEVGESEVEATYAADFVAAVEKCVLSRMTLEFLSR